MRSGCMGKKASRRKRKSDVLALTTKQFREPIRIGADVAAGFVPPEQARRNDYEIVNAAVIDSNMPQVAVVRNRTQWAIERYHVRGLIDERQFLAGEMFRKCYERAGIGQRVTANLDGVGGAWQCTYGMAVTERQADARKELRAVLDRMPDRIADIAVRAIIHDARPDDLGYGSRSAMVGMAYIRMCLDVIADHYRLALLEKNA